MRRNLTAVLASALVVAIFGAGAGTASAATATFSPGGAITATNDGAVTMLTGFGVRSCSSWVLRGSVVPGTYTTSTVVAIGSITSGTTSGCTLGGLPIPNLSNVRLPWPIAMTGSSVIAGGAATGLQIQGFSYVESSTGCSWTGDVAFNLSVASGSPSTQPMVLPGSTLTGPCGDARIAGRFRLTPPQL